MTKTERSKKIVGIICLIPALVITALILMAVLYVVVSIFLITWNRNDYSFRYLVIIFVIIFISCFLFLTGIELLKEPEHSEVD